MKVEALQLLKTLNLIKEYGELLISGDLKANQNQVKALHAKLRIKEYSELLISSNSNVNQEQAKEAKELRAELREVQFQVLNEFSAYIEGFLKKNPARRYEVIKAFSDAEAASYSDEFLKETAQDSLFQRLMHFARCGSVTKGVTLSNMASLSRYHDLSTNKTENSDVSSQAIDEFKKELPLIQKKIEELNKIDNDLHERFGASEKKENGETFYEGSFSKTVIAIVQDGIDKKQNQSLGVLGNLMNIKYHTINYGQGRESLQAFMEHFKGEGATKGVTYYLSLKLNNSVDQIACYLSIFNKLIEYLRAVYNSIDEKNDIKKPIRDASDRAIKCLTSGQKHLQNKLHALGYTFDEILAQSKKQIAETKVETKVEAKPQSNNVNPLLDAFVIDLENKQKNIVETNNSFDKFGLSKNHFDKSQQKQVNQTQSVSNGHANNNSATEANNNAQKPKPPVAAPKKGFGIGVMGELASKIGAALPAGTAKNAAAVKSTVLAAPQANINNKAPTSVSSKQDIDNEFDDFVMIEEVKNSPSNSKS